MPIHQITPQQAVNQYLQQELFKREKVLFHMLSRLGQECVTEAKNNGGYLDDTGNLRASVGYAVLKNGQVLEASSFKNTLGNSNLSEGQSEGLLEKIRNDFQKGWALILLAGMNYAAYVETRRNVISSAEIFAKEQAPILLKRLFGKDNIKRK